MWSHSVNCHPAKVTSPLKVVLELDLATLEKFKTVDLVGLITYRGDILARRRSPTPVLTGLKVEQLRSCDEWRYHNARPTEISTLRSESVGYCYREQCSWFVPVSASNNFTLRYLHVHLNVAIGPNRWGYERSRLGQLRHTIRSPPGVARQDFSSETSTCRIIGELNAIWSNGDHVTRRRRHVGGLRGIGRTIESRTQRAVSVCCWRTGGTCSVTLYYGPFTLEIPIAKFYSER